MKALAIGGLALLALVMPAGAITGGSVDPGGVHPNVGLVVLRFYNGNAILCSGTLIHPQVVLTAGHCVQAFQGAIARGRSDLSQLSVNFVTPHAPGPVGGDNRPVASMVLHPDYDPLLVPTGTDIGLLILEDPVAGITPATLPTAGYLDALKQAGQLKPKDTELRVAGFGTHLDPLAPPTPTLGNPPWPRRYVDVRFKGLLQHFLSTANSAHSGDGGIGPGDSGGPVFVTDPASGVRIQVGVASWTDAQSVGQGASARLDLQAVLDFIAAHLPD